MIIANGLHNHSHISSEPLGLVVLLFCRRYYWKKCLVVFYWRFRRSFWWCLVGGFVYIVECCPASCMVCVSSGRQVHSYVKKVSCFEVGFSRDILVYFPWQNFCKCISFFLICSVYLGVLLPIASSSSLYSPMFIPKCVSWDSTLPGAIPEYHSSTTLNIYAVQIVSSEAKGSIYILKTVTS